jgi:hypothetical protein
MLLGITGLTWALMMAALVQNEVIPYFEYQASPTYRSFLKERPTREFSLRTVYLGSEAVGQSRTMIYPGPHESRQVFTEFDMSMAGLLTMMGMKKQLNSAVDRISIVSRQSINAAYQLEWFKMSGQVMLPIKVEGRREGNLMKVTYDVASMKGETDLPFERMAMLGGSYTPLQGVGKPSVGKKWKLQTLDVEVFSGKPKFVTVFARIEAKETIVYQGRNIEAYRIEFRKDLNKELPISRLWVDEDGEVLIEEMQVFNLSCRVVLEKKEPATPEQVSRFVGQR